MSPHAALRLCVVDTMLVYCTVDDTRPTLYSRPMFSSLDRLRQTCDLPTCLGWCLIVCVVLLASLMTSMSAMGLRVSHYTEIQKLLVCEPSSRYLTCPRTAELCRLVSRARSWSTAVLRRLYFLCTLGEVSCSSFECDCSPKYCSDVFDL